MVFNTDRGIAKEYKEFDEEFNTDRDIAKGNITFQSKEEREDEDYKLQEVLRPMLRDGCNLEEFKSFTLLWRLCAKCHDEMDDRELRLVGSEKTTSPREMPRSPEPEVAGQPRWSQHTGGPD